MAFFSSIKSDMRVMRNDYWAIIGIQYFVLHTRAAFVHVKHCVYSFQPIPGLGEEMFGEEGRKECNVLMYCYRGSEIQKL